MDGKFKNKLQGITVVALTSLFCLASCNSPQPSPPTTNDAGVVEVPVPSFAEQYQEMAQVLDLPPDENARLKAAFDEMDSDLTAWLEGPEGAALYNEEAALRKAVKERDLEDVRKITGKSVTQRDKFRALIEEKQAGLRAALSPESRLAWDSHQVAQQMIDLMSEIPITAEQESIIRENAAAAVSASATETNPMAAGYMELETWAEGEVLDDVQRTKYQSIKDKNPMRTMGF